MTEEEWLSQCPIIFTGALSSGHVTVTYGAYRFYNYSHVDTQQLISDTESWFTHSFSLQIVSCFCSFDEAGRFSEECHNAVSPRSIIYVCWFVN